MYNESKAVRLSKAKIQLKRLESVKTPCIIQYYKIRNATKQLAECCKQDFIILETSRFSFIQQNIFRYNMLITETQLRF